MLLLLLSHFSHVQFCATPSTAAHQAPPSLGFSRQKHWSGLPFLSPMHESEKWKWSRSVVSDPLRPHGLQPTRLLHPWDSSERRNITTIIRTVTFFVISNNRCWRQLKITTNIYLYSQATIHPGEEKQCKHIKTGKYKDTHRPKLNEK